MNKTANTYYKELSNKISVLQITTLSLFDSDLDQQNEHEA